MADDEQDFIERTQSSNEKLNGRPISIDEMADDWAFVAHNLNMNVALP